MNVFCSVESEGEDDRDSEEHEAGDTAVRFKVSCDWWSAGHVTTVITSDWPGGGGRGGRGQDAAAPPRHPAPPQEQEGQPAGQWSQSTAELELETFR